MCPIVRSPSQPWFPPRHSHVPGSVTTRTVRVSRRPCPFSQTVTVSAAAASRLNMISSRSDGVLPFTGPSQSPPRLRTRRSVSRQQCAASKLPRAPSRHMSWQSSSLRAVGTSWPGGGHRRQYPLGVRVDGVAPECRPRAVGRGGAAAARLGVDGDVPRPRRRRPAPRHEPAPRLHRLVERVRIGRRHDAADCVMARKLLQAERPQQSFHPPWPVPGDVVPEPHHRRRPLRGEHHRHRDHGQHPSVAVPQRRTRRPRILQPFELLSGVLDQALHHRLQSFLLGSFRPGFACQAVAMSYTMAVGYQGALTLVRHVLLRPGDPVWIEDPGYHLARQALETAGARVIPVRVDQDGLRVASGAAAAPRAKLAVVTPTHQCPTGVALSLPRRLELLAWAAEAGSWILEDDYDSEYRYTGRPLPALKSLDRGARVLYAGSFSKTLF